MWQRNKRMRNGGSYWRSGDFNQICEISGFKVKRSECKKTWDNHWVRKCDWEPRHPQDFVRGVVDKIKVDDPRPEGVDVFVSDNEVLAEDL